MTDPNADSPARPAARGSRDEIIRRFVQALSHETPAGVPRIGRGNLAALRRMDPDAHDVPAFWRLLAEATDGAMVGSDETTARWALIAHGMALMAPRLRERVEPGRALQAIGYAEGRLARLLAARGEQFRALVPRLCRHLAAREQAVDWSVLAQLILAEGRNEPAAEAIRRRIASHYYRAAAKVDAA